MFAIHLGGFTSISFSDDMLFIPKWQDYWNMKVEKLQTIDPSYYNCNTPD